MVKEGLKKSTDSFMIFELELLPGNALIRAVASIGVEEFGDVVKGLVEEER